jgi:hypothetical protein
MGKCLRSSSVNTLTHRSLSSLSLAFRSYMTTSQVGGPSWGFAPASARLSISAPFRFMFLQSFSRQPRVRTEEYSKLVCLNGSRYCQTLVCNGMPVYRYLLTVWGPLRKSVGRKPGMKVSEGNNKTVVTGFRFLAPRRETGDPWEHHSVRSYIPTCTAWTLVGNSQLDGSAAVAVAPQVPVVVRDEAVCMIG